MIETDLFADNGLQTAIAMLFEVNCLKKTENHQECAHKKKDGSTGKTAGRVAFRIVITLVSVFFGTLLITCIFMFSYVMSLRGEEIDMNLHSLNLNYTSFIYVNDEKGNPVEYKHLYGGESNRIWVDYKDIPQYMKDSMVAIEDKRFWEHKGVDWWRTIGAAGNLLSSGSNSYGGSTITQQLIKNLTGDNDVSISRKLKEIFRAENLEKKYTKEEILESYLNVVNFGSGCKGVQAAANLYFGKDIKDCTLAECAAIAGITQNPYAYSPMNFPEKNKERQQTVLGEMYSQEKITKEEYDNAMAESENMNFVFQDTPKTAIDDTVYNWYVEAMLQDIVTDLQKELNCTEKDARNMIYYGGLKIYSAMDENTQNLAESTVENDRNLKSDPDMQCGVYMMDYSGRVLAIVGSRDRKEGNLWFNYATDAKRQPGSSFKPIAAYAPAMDNNLIHYSSMVLDQPIPNYFQDGTAGPNNYDYRFRGPITVQYALQQSYNPPAVRVYQQLGARNGYNFLTKKLGFTSLVGGGYDDSHLGVAIGGLHNGVTVKEMTAAFQIFGNGGQYNRPYTYYYVEDSEGNVILDNRNNTFNQAIKSSTATVMQKLLTTVVTNGTGVGAGVNGWQIFGKTGTTDIDDNSYFVGGSPYAVIGVWTGYRTPSRLKNTNAPKSVFQTLMSNYLKNKQQKQFSTDPNVIAATYCTQSGDIANSGCGSTATGWYDKSRMPAVCTQHEGNSVTGENRTESASSGSNSTVSSASSSSSVSSQPSSSSSSGSGASSAA